jgi:hypothetical protein
MLETQLLDLLVSGGSNIGFAVFLFWQYREQKKEASHREEKQEIRERDLRDRYDSVIKEYRAKEEKLHARIEDLIKLLDDKG